MTDSKKMNIQTLEVPDDPEEVYRLFYEQGWTDGFPIIPPHPRSRYQDAWRNKLYG